MVEKFIWLKIKEKVGVIANYQRAEVVQEQNSEDPGNYSNLLCFIEYYRNFIICRSGSSNRRSSRSKSRSPSKGRSPKSKNGSRSRSVSEDSGRDNHDRSLSRSPKRDDKD